MANEIPIPLPASPERPNFGLVFAPQTQPSGLERYRQAGDLDSKALVLNGEIIRQEAGIATDQAVRSLAQIVSEQQSGLGQYRSDAVAGLTGENLVAVLNGLSIAASSKDQVTDAITQIKQAKRGEELRDAGLGDEIRFLQRDLPLDALKEEVLSELAERLTDPSGDPLEHRILIRVLDAMLTPDGLKNIADHEALVALARIAPELSNDALRAAIKNLQDKLEL